MFGRKNRQSTPAPAAPASDQYRIKATGERVTVLRNLGNGEVKVAQDSGGVLRDRILRRDDITPA